MQCTWHLGIIRQRRCCRSHREIYTHFNRQNMNIAHINKQKLAVAIHFFYITWWTTLFLSMSCVSLRITSSRFVHGHKVFVYQLSLCACAACACVFFCSSLHHPHRLSVLPRCRVCARKTSKLHTLEKHSRSRRKHIAPINPYKLVHDCVHIYVRRNPENKSNKIKYYTIRNVCTHIIYVYNAHFNRALAATAVRMCACSVCTKARSSTPPIAADR